MNHGDTRVMASVLRGLRVSGCTVPIFSSTHPHGSPAPPGSWRGSRPPARSRGSSCPSPAHSPAPGGGSRTPLQHDARRPRPASSRRGCPGRCRPAGRCARRSARSTRSKGAMPSSLECLASMPRAITSSMTLKMQPQECHRNGLPAAWIRSITRRYCGMMCWRMMRGETSVLVLKPRSSPKRQMAKMPAYWRRKRCQIPVIRSPMRR